MLLGKVLLGFHFFAFSVERICQFVREKKDVIKNENNYSSLKKSTAVFLVEEVLVVSISKKLRGDEIIIPNYILLFCEVYHPSICMFLKAQLVLSKSLNIMNTSVFHGLVRE